MTQQGIYDDPVSRRMAYDSDGSTVLILAGGVGAETFDPTEMDQNQREDWNTEDYIETDFYDTASYLGNTYVVIFPELRNITHVYRNLAASSEGTSTTVTYEVSVDTTDGEDGTWTTAGNKLVEKESTSPNFRTPLSLTATAVKAIRHQGPTVASDAWGFAQWHIYGYRAAGETPDRVEFCDFVDDDLTIDFDFGDHARNSESIWSPRDIYNQASGLYLFNRSTTIQALDVQVSFEALYSDIESYMLLSKNNITYSPTITYSAMNAGEMVGPIYLRHNPSILADLEVKAGRLRIDVGTGPVGSFLYINTNDTEQSGQIVYPIED